MGKDIGWLNSFAKGGPEPQHTMDTGAWPAFVAVQLAWLLNDNQVPEPRLI